LQFLLHTHYFFSVQSSQYSELPQKQYPKMKPSLDQIPLSCTQVPLVLHLRWIQIITVTIPLILLAVIISAANSCTPALIGYAMFVAVICWVAIIIAVVAHFISSIPVAVVSLIVEIFATLYVKTLFIKPMGPLKWVKN